MTRESLLYTDFEEMLLEYEELLLSHDKDAAEEIKEELINMYHRALREL